MAWLGSTIKKPPKLIKESVNRTPPTIGEGKPMKNKKIEVAIPAKLRKSNKNPEEGLVIFSMLM
jgi:hypothetical protein